MSIWTMPTAALLGWSADTLLSIKVAYLEQASHRRRTQSARDNDELAISPVLSGIASPTPYFRLALTSATPMNKACCLGNMTEGPDCPAAPRDHVMHICHARCTHCSLDDKRAGGWGAYHTDR